MKATQKGFTVIEGLLITIIVLLVGFIGYYVHHSQQQTNKTLSSAANASQAASSSKATPATPTYLTIKEWGIKFKTTAQSNDSYYVFYADSNQFLYLDSKDLDAHTAYDGSSCKGEYIAIVGRYAKDDPALNNDAPLGAVGQRRTVGNYVYTFNTHKQYAAACLFDTNQNSIEPNTTVYNEKVAAYTTMYGTITTN